MQPPVPPKTSRASLWTSRIAVFSGMVLLTAAFLHRLFGMPTPVAFNLVWAAYLGVALAFLTAIAASIGIWRSGEAGTSRIVFGVLFGLALLAGPFVLVLLARDYPPVSDVSTDLVQPPPFQVLAANRGQGANSPAYHRERFAAEQKRAYPELKPLAVDRPAEEAFEIVVETLNKLRIPIVHQEAPVAESGRPGIIEAVDRTLVAGFYDDVVVRVADDDGRGARIDLRSQARYDDWSELGRNAERVRTLMREIAMRIEATVPSAEEKGPRGKQPSRPILKRGKADGPGSETRRRSRDRAP